MGVISTVLLVFFVIVSVLLVLLVLVQTDEGDGLGGIFAGGSSSAFGSRSGNVLTRATTVLGASFLIISLGLALINRTPSDAGVIEAGRELSGTNQTDWLQGELNPDAVVPESSVEQNDGTPSQEGTSPEVQPQQEENAGVETGSATEEIVPDTENTGE
jgi:preprotein translocase subunit SecG